MALSTITARCHLISMAPMTQSKMYDVPELEGESKDAYDKRNWRLHQTVRNGTVHIPARAMHMALADAARYSKRQIPGQGKATWTAKFAAGIAMLSDVNLGIDAAKTDYIDIPCNADGVRGSGKRVMRRFPIMPEWEAKFDVIILDPIITEEIFSEMLELAGLFVGVGQYRPQNSGTNGRWRVESVEWIADRKSAVPRAA
jgi:hypothetical protein